VPGILSASGRVAHYRNGLPISSLIVGTAAVRGDGASREYFPLEYPQCRLFYWKPCCMRLKRRRWTFIPGIIRGHDAFYAESSFCNVDYLKLDRPDRRGGIDHLQ
jgi:uridine phosphorylase